jgi:hypothetical protein
MTFFLVAELNGFDAKLSSTFSEFYASEGGFFIARSRQLLKGERNFEVA